VNTLCKRHIKELARQHPDAAADLNNWFAVASKASWNSLADVRVNFAEVDQVGRVLIFNIRRNYYRLIVKADFRAQLLMVKELLSHKSYMRKEWMKWS
jgi:mRNA interferase HigB